MRVTEVGVDCNERLYARVITEAEMENVLAEAGLVNGEVPAYTAHIAVVTVPEGKDEAERLAELLALMRDAETRVHTNREDRVKKAERVLAAYRFHVEPEEWN